ncbi:MAG: prepilin-type N-terminal cleavage/methylation domain-containing protein [Planctomycetes bacterium]|nr:prepilin-type N-terminal cleavage/methylation domain-containing protein [Planctomycetota bacterium]
MRKSNAGFTLMEIMAVVIIIGILSTVVATFGPKMLCRLKSKTAETQLRNIIKPIELYHEEENKYPSDLNDLQPKGFYEGKISDPWDKPIQFKIVDESNRLFELRSGGCNGRLNDADDVIISNQIQNK